MSHLLNLLSLVALTLGAQEGARDGEVASTAALDSIVEVIDFREAKLGEALRLLSEEAGVNLVASEAAGELTVSIYLQDLSVRQAIEAIALTYGLWYREDEGSRIVRLMTAEEFARDLRLFRDERTQVFTLLFPNSLDVAHAISNLFGDRVHLSQDRQVLYDEYNELSERMRRFDLLSRRGQSQGGGQGLFGGNQTSLFGNGNNGNFANGANNGSYSSQTPPPRTRSVAEDEYEFSSDQLRELEQLRVKEEDLSELAGNISEEAPTIFVSVMRRTNRIAVRTADSGAMKEIERIIRELDVPTPQVLLEVKVLSLDLADDFLSSFDMEYSQGKSTAGLTTGDIALNTGLADSGALVYRFVDDHFRARLQLLERDGRITELATPLLLVANNEVARLFIGQERPLVRSITSQTIVSQTVTTSTPSSTIEIRSVGTTLLVTPNVNADRTVTLRVLEEMSNVLPGAASIPIIDANGNVTEQPVDVVASRSLTGTVVAKDGLTLALGGLIEETVSDTREGIPILMDLPLIGGLFRREVKSRSRRELLVLIRPYVLFTTTEGDEISRDLARRLIAHPSAQGDRLEIDDLGAFDKSEAPRPPLAKNPLLDALRFQSGLPAGGKD